MALYSRLFTPNGEAVDSNGSVWKRGRLGSGLPGRDEMPELRYNLRAYAGRPYCDIQVTVRNTTGKQIVVEAIRSVDVKEGGIFNVDGPVVPFPFPSPARFSSSVQKPELESRPVYTGHRMASK